MYDNLRSILKNRGGNDYKPEHNRKRKRQKNAGTAVDLTVPMEDYRECVRLVGMSDDFLKMQVAKK
jgi:hypothetical protein